MLASQSQRSGRDYLLIIAFQSWKAKDRWDFEFSKKSANDFLYCSLSRVVTGRRRRAMLGKDLR